jgi:hypothetical protein
MRDRLFAALAALWILFAVPVLLLAGMSTQDGEPFRFPRIRDAIDAAVYFLLVAPPLICAALWLQPAHLPATVLGRTATAVAWLIPGVLGLIGLGFVALGAGGLFLA